MRDEKRALFAKGEDADDRFLLAPTVGRYLEAPAPGSFLAPGSPAGIFMVLRKTFRLVVPPECTGVVREVLVKGRAAPVEYRQPLLRLSRSAAAVDLGAEVTAAEEAADEGVPEGAIAVRSPTDGIFYRRPSPEEPVYAEEGDVIERGQVLGLVEVMKCFNQITMKGDAPRARVTRILARDAGEVRLGQVLILLTPA